MKRNLTISVLAALVWMVLLTGAAIAKDPVYTGFLGNTAAGGYDVVAYFKEGQPVKGKEMFQTAYKGADWLFSSKEHLAAFKANPEQYAPQYGGYCAWAVAQGYTAKGDPLQWTIHENKLYLNYDTEVQNKWLKNMPSFIEQGDRNWPGVLD